MMMKKNLFYHLNTQPNNQTFKLCIGYLNYLTMRHIQKQLKKIHKCKSVNSNMRVMSITSDSCRILPKIYT